MEMSEVSTRLVTTIAPYIKQFPDEGAPQFRKKLTGDEVEELLSNLFQLAIEVKEAA